MNHSIPMPGASRTLTNIPAEMRNKIWVLVLTQQDGLPIAVLSRPRRGVLDRKPARSANFAALLRVSKRIYRETRPIFYRSNIVAIGNRCYASPFMPNAHALKGFIRRVPKIDIAWITHLSLHIELQGKAWEREQSLKEVARGIKDMLYVCKSVKKYFKAVKYIDFEICRTPKGDDSYFDDDFLLESKSENLTNVKKAIEILGVCENIVEITFLRTDWIDVDMIVGDVLGADFWVQDSEMRESPQHTVVISVDTKSSTSDAYGKKMIDWDLSKD